MGNVARLAGVSVQTVSRMTTGSGHVRPDTRTKVLRAINRPGYSLDRVAQALRRGSLKTIGVLTQQTQRTDETLTTAGVLEAATIADYAVNLVQVERPVSDNLRQAIYRLSYQAIDGLIVVQAGRAGREHLVLPPSIPVAVSDSTLVDHYPSASTDQVDGVRDAVEHLLELGHRNVQHVCGPGSSQSNLIHRATWARCLQEAGSPVPEPISGDRGAAANYVTGRLLAANPEVTAVFCTDDELALDLIRTMYEQGRRVPDDVSVADFDGLDVGEYGFPPLATVRQNFRRHGREIVDLVLEQVTSEVHDGSRSIIIPAELIPRGNTAPSSATRRTSTVRHRVPELVEPGRDGRVVRVGVTPSTSQLSRAVVEEWSVLGSFLLQAG